MPARPVPPPRLWGPCGSVMQNLSGWPGLVSPPGASLEERALEQQQSVRTEGTAMSVTAQLAGRRRPQAPARLWVMKDAEA